MNGWGPFAKHKFLDLLRPSKFKGTLSVQNWENMTQSTISENLREDSASPSKIVYMGPKISSIGTHSNNSDNSSDSDNRHKSHNSNNTNNTNNTNNSNNSDIHKNNKTKHEA